MENNCFYVYAFFRPWNGEPFYIGKGKGRRIDRHERSSKSHRNKHFRSIFSKAARLGLIVPRAIIRDGLKEKEAFELEVALIQIIGRRANGGPLVNLTDGGEGVSGYQVTASDRKKISEGLRGRPKSPEHIAAVVAALKNSQRAKDGHERTAALRRGKKHSAESRAKMSATLSGRVLGQYSVERREAISAGKRGKNRKPFTAQALANMSAAQKGRPGKSLTKETKEKISAALSGRKRGPHSEEHREKIRLSNIATWSSRTPKEFSPDHRAKISGALKGRKKSAAHVQAMKTAWERRRATTEV